jgi:hypothetical protein
VGIANHPCQLGITEMLLKALSNHENFEKLLREGDPTVKDACLKVALPAG